MFSPKMVPTVLRTTTKRRLGSSVQFSKGKKCLLGVAVATPTLAIAQGAFLLSNYRSNHGNAPHPISPSRGIVVVSPNDSPNDSPCPTPRRHISKANEEAPLRLLVIGDSLAAGVGISQSGTPVLPESIARALSKALGGRAVYWKCHGMPGADAASILKLLESFDSIETHDDGENRLLRGFGPNARGTRLPGAEAAGAPSRNQLPEGKTDGGEKYEGKISVSSLSRHESKECEDRLWTRWRARIFGEQSQKLDPEIFGHWDVAVVITGVNDLKRIVLPWMNQSENKDKDTETNFATDLQRILHELEDNMKLGVERALTRFGKSADDLPGPIRRRLTLNRSNTKCDSDTVSQYPERVVQAGKEIPCPRPIIVLPGFCAEAVPAFRYPPLRWFAMPFFTYIDNLKHNIAKTNGFILYVSPPSMDSIAEYENGKGRLWATQSAEHVLITVKDVTRRACLRVEEAMRQYYFNRKDESEECSSTREEHEEMEQNYNESVDNNLAVSLPDSQPTPGERTTSLDGIHPNDMGYDFYGRHIAAAIVNEWVK